MEGVINMWLKILSGIWLFICFSGMFMICNERQANEMSAREFWLTELGIAVVLIILIIKVPLRG